VTLKARSLKNEMIGRRDEKDKELEGKFSKKKEKSKLLCLILLHVTV